MTDPSSEYPLVSEFFGHRRTEMSAGNGVRLFENGGRYFFRVDSSLMHWNVKVIELTPQEAAQYKPKRAGS